MTRVVRVRVDEPAVDKPFDYTVPDSLDGQVELGAVVRVDLHGRRVRGWVVDDDVDAPAKVALKPIARVTGWGPPRDLLELADWAAWRWAGRPPHFLRTASAPGAVRGLPSPPSSRPAAHGVPDALATEALGAGRAVLRSPPASDPYSLLLHAAELGPTLVVCASHAQERQLGARLRRAGLTVAHHPRDWGRARAGADVTIGARAAAWAPVPGLAAVIVLDEHEEVHQEEASPTWHARDVAVERARRAGVPCVLTSPCPSLPALDWGRLVVPSRTAERAGWPVVDVVDRHREDPLRSDLYSERLVELVRSGKRVVCVLNRKGRAALLACAKCGELARCETCAAAVAMGESILVCRRCAATRPVVCASCGSGTLKQRRLGVTRAREDLERLARVPVGEVTGASGDVPDTAVLVGTEAVLRRVDTADAVAFLDLDNELLAPRYRAGEEAMALIARAARLVGGKAGGGRILLQTRQPKHDVVQAALLADPSRLSDAERERRRILRFPPSSAVAHVSGAAAAVYVDGFAGRLDVEVLGPAADGSYLLRGPDVTTLCDALAEVPRTGGRVRIAVDPLRI